MNEKNKEFLTPLHVATDKSHYDVMELLLKHGAKVYYKAYSARLSIDACGSTQANLCGWIERSRNTVNLKEFLKETFKGTKETLSRVMPTFL